MEDGEEREKKKKKEGALWAFYIQKTRNFKRYKAFQRIVESVESAVLLMAIMFSPRKFVMSPHVSSFLAEIPESRAIKLESFR